MFAADPELFTERILSPGRIALDACRSNSPRCACFVSLAFHLATGVECLGLLSTLAVVVCRHRNASRGTTRNLESSRAHSTSIPTRLRATDLLPLILGKSTGGGLGSCASKVALDIWSSPRPAIRSACEGLDSGRRLFLEGTGLKASLLADMADK